VQIESRRSESATLETNGDPVFRAAGTTARGEFRCVECGYGISVRTVLPHCPMCRGSEWEAPTTSPYGPAPL
jgi:rubrerythrin